MTHLALCAVLLLASSGSAQAPEPIRTLPGLGSCGDWYAERRNQGRIRWETDATWVQGFVSGHNWYAEPPDKTDIMVEPNDIAIWVDTYCQKNPTKVLAEAAAALIEAHGGRNLNRIRR
jgi:hypothetical protein